MISKVLRGVTDRGISSERILSDFNFPDPKDIVFYEVALSKEDVIEIEGTVLEKDLYVAQNSESGKPAVNDAPSSNPALTSLPNNLTSINNHQFSKNQDLQTAIIPDKITSIGPGAFANCLNLTNVVIPRSVKNIGYNAFFNCVSLDTITYKGSKAEWRKIKRGSNWLAKAKTDKVICSDSVIIVNQLR